MTGRLEENNMFYRVGEKVMIKSKEELRNGGMGIKSIRTIKHLCGRVFKIVAMNENSQHYVIEGTNIPVVDADIAHLVL